MSGIVTEIYVSIDGLEFVKLDLHKDESINMRQTQKDLQNLSRIFAPFSQGFTFPATSKNRAAFGFFGDTDVIKINVESKFIAKSYINGSLNNTGFIQLSKISYKNNRPEDFTGAFTTSMTNLKDRIGDDLLSNLTDEVVPIDWSVEGVQNSVRSERTVVIDGVSVRYFAPLISVNRVWGYDLTDNSLLQDNIAYSAASDIKGNNLIRPEELRPCINYGSIIDLISNKYNLLITSPLETREEYLDLRVWCNSERISDSTFKVLPINNPFGMRGAYDTRNERTIPDPKKYSITANLVDNSFEVFKDPQRSFNEYIEDAFQFRVKFDGVVVTGGTETPEVEVRYIRKADDVILRSDTFELEGNVFECITQIDDTLFGTSDYLEFYIQVRFNQPTSWSSSSFRMYFRYYDGRFGTFSRRRYAWYFFDSLSNDNSSQVSGDSIDLINTLPNIKVIDFLNSHFKSFNVSIFDTSPDDENLYWLTPEDINSTGKVYSKAVLDYTQYVDSKAYNKEKPNDFNYYNFKHADSEYFSNKRYIEAFGLEYGQAVHPETPPEDLKEFKVETDFSIIPPVVVNGARGLETAYGFTDDTPEIIETGETRYTPNYDELTVFYTHGATNCAAVGLLGVTTVQTGFQQFENRIGVFSLTSYMKVLPWNKNGYSFAFSVLRNNDVDYINSLYDRYYLAQTIRLLDPNVLSQTFDLILPPNEIHLNEATTIQGAGDTPKGFRLQNDIIIGENLFSITDSTIDQTTGKTKLTLLNY